MEGLEIPWSWSGWVGSGPRSGPGSAWEGGGEVSRLTRCCRFRSDGDTMELAFVPHDRGSERGYDGEDRGVSGERLAMG